MKLKKRKINNYNWDEWFKQLELFITENNRFPFQIPPKRQKNKFEKRENFIGVWLMRQRFLYKNYKLEQVKIDQLEKIGFEWVGEKVKTNLMHEKMIKFFETYSKLPSPTENISEYQCLHKMIKDYENIKLPVLLQYLLKSLNFDSWLAKQNTKYTWNDMYLLCKEFMERNDRTPKTYPKKPKSEIRLGNWLNDQKSLYFKNNINGDKSEKLKILLGINLAPRRELESMIWDNNLEKVKSFYDQNNRFPKSTNIIGKSDEGKLGDWLVNQKNWANGNFKYNKPFSKIRKNRLINIGFDFSVKRKSFEYQINLLLEFMNMNKGKLPTYATEYPIGNNLGKWLNNLKSNLKLNKISKERLIFLNENGLLLKLCPIQKEYKLNSKISKNILLNETTKLF